MGSFLHCVFLALALALGLTAAAFIFMLLLVVLGGLFTAGPAGIPAFVAASLLPVLGMMAVWFLSILLVNFIACLAQAPTSTGGSVGTAPLAGKHLPGAMRDVAISGILLNALPFGVALAYLAVRSTL